MRNPCILTSGRIATTLTETMIQFCPTSSIMNILQMFIIREANYTGCGSEYLRRLPQSQEQDQLPCLLQRRSIASSVSSAASQSKWHAVTETWTLNAHPCQMWTGGGSMETRRQTDGWLGSMGILTDVSEARRTGDQRRWRLRWYWYQYVYRPY